MAAAGLPPERAWEEIRSDDPVSKVSTRIPPMAIRPPMGFHVGWRCETVLHY